MVGFTTTSILHGEEIRTETRVTHSNNNYYQVEDAFE